MRIFIPLLFLLVGTSPTASLHKCIGADGVPSYQSLPCAPGQRTAWTRSAPPLAAPAPAPAAPRVASKAPPRAATRTAVVRKAADPSASRCAAARRAADLTRDRLWNRLSFRQRSDLDAKVRKACTKE